MASNKIVFEISIDELTRRVKEQSGLSGKKVEKVVENVLCLIDFDMFLSQEIEHFSEEVEDESSEEECDDCEGKCRADETEKCDNCAVELRIGCGNKPSDHSIFNGLCDDCREEEEEEEEDAHECELCKKHVQETEYLPSKEDQEKQQILGNDYCLECYKKVEKFEFVENIDLDKHE